MTNQFIGAAAETILYDAGGLYVGWRTFDCRFGSVTYRGIATGTALLGDDTITYMALTNEGNVIGGSPYIPYTLPLGRVTTAGGVITNIEHDAALLTACSIPDADYVTYTPGDESDWPDVPSTVQDIGDYLAGRLHTVEDGGHDPVTLTAEADAILLLTGQELGLDVQTANTVLAGPESGTDAIPTMRALVEDDIPDLSGLYTTPDAADAIADGLIATHAGIASAHHTRYTDGEALAAAQAGAGIADNNLVQIDDADAADDDFAKFTASGLEGRSYAEVKTDLGLEADPALKRLLIHIDGGGSAITTGIKVHLPDMPACTVEAWTFIANASGSIVLDFWTDSYANSPPTVADTMITTGTKPVLSSAQKNQDLTVDWAVTAIAAGATLTVNVDSATTVTWVDVTLRLRMT